MFNYKQFRKAINGWFELAWSHSPCKALETNIEWARHNEVKQAPPRVQLFMNPIRSGGAECQFDAEKRVERTWRNHEATLIVTFYGDLYDLAVFCRDFPTFQESRDYCTEHNISMVLASSIMDITEVEKLDYVPRFRADFFARTCDFSELEREHFTSVDIDVNIVMEDGSKKTTSMHIGP